MNDSTPGPFLARNKKIVRGVASAALIVWGAYLVIAFLDQVDGEAFFSLLRDTHPALFLLLPVPFFLSALLDSIAWDHVFRSMRWRLRMKSLLQVRIGAEAISLAFPGGVPLAETFRPGMVKKLEGPGIPVGVAAVILRKCLFGIAQGAYFLLALLVAWDQIQGAAFGVFGIGGFEWIVAVMGVVILGVSFTMLRLVTRQGGARLPSWTRKIVPIAAWPAFVDRLEGKIGETRASMAEFRRLNPFEVLRLTGILLVAWLLEAAESFIYISIVLPDISFLWVIGLEVSISFVRSTLVLLPGGLGIQEYGYAAFLQQFGVSDPVSSAAVVSLLRRVREVLVVLVGFGILANLTRKNPMGADGTQQA